MNPKHSNTAFGWPGIEPRWTHGDKDGVGTAYAASSRIWFTLWNGIITEVYYPTVYYPQMRDLQSGSNIRDEEGSPWSKRIVAASFGPASR